MNKKLKAQVNKMHQSSDQQFEFQPARFFSTVVSILRQILSNIIINQQDDRMESTLINFKCDNMFE